MQKLILSVALVGLFSASGALAQDYNEDPSFGSVSLSAGFAPDPYTVDLASGGSIDVDSRLGGDCSGYVANAPDFRVNYESGSLPLIFSVNSDADTTLVINAPSGDWVCDDDGGDGLNPSIRFNAPQSGQYDIWVGTYSSSAFEDATLFISEITSQ